MMAALDTTIANLIARTASRLAECVARYERGYRSIERTLWLVTSSQAILDRPRPAFSGGSPDTVPEPIVREQLRMLIDSGVLPPGGLGCLWEWICRLEHPCRGCGARITPGETEVEVTTRRGVVLFLHPHCLELWAEEAQPRARAVPERRRGLA